MTSRLIDITRPLNPSIAVYPGNPPVQFTQAAHARGGRSALTVLALGSHTGTHIDAPSHITADAPGTAHYPLDTFIGPCVVVESMATEILGRADMPPTDTPRILFKTRNSSQDMTAFDPGFVALDESAAEALVQRGVRLVGIDGPSIKKKGVRDRVHAILLEAGIAIVEGLWLREVDPGDYTLLCLPLPVDLDGAPVRAVLQVQ